MKSPLVTTAAIVVALAGCASSAPPTVQTGPNAEITADGLHRVDNSVMAMAWVKPDMDLQVYTKVMIDEVTVAYQKEPRATTQSPGASEDNFALTPSKMAELKSWFQEAVVAALTKDDGWKMVDAPGPDVLHLSAFLIDLVVRVPAQDMARQRTYTRSYGEVTVVLELHDSESEEILARVAERRDPTTATDSQLARVSPSAVRADVQWLFEYWANQLRQGLDRVREVEQQ